jgi:hypothetical protein
MITRAQQAQQAKQAAREAEAWRAEQERRALRIRVLSEQINPLLPDIADQLEYVYDHTGFDVSQEAHARLVIDGETFYLRHTKKDGITWRLEILAQITDPTNPDEGKIYRAGWGTEDGYRDDDLQEQVLAKIGDALIDMERLRKEWAERAVAERQRANEYEPIGG